MGNFKISGDLLIEILARLPVKSLMRFKCVCKYFYSLIKSDNYFKRKHYEISRGRSDYVAFKRQIGLDPWPMRYEEVYGFVYKETDCDGIGCVDIPMPSSLIRDVKCADGVLCLVTYKRDVPRETNWYILIWNPSTREIKELPHIEQHDKFNREYVAIGLGFCSDDMTGKVVMIWISRDSHNHFIPTVMICSQAGNSWVWRRLNLFLPIICVRDGQSNFYLKGKYYWVCKLQEQNHEHLLWFDFTNEVFGKIELTRHPPGKFWNGAQSDSWAVVSVMNETIALLSYWDDENHFEIWSMNEHNNNNKNIISWNKYASFDCGHAYWWPISFWNLGRHLLVYCPIMLGDNDEYDRVHHLISLDLATQERKIIYNIQWDHSAQESPFVYHESLKFF